jgi:methionyl-tRNA formyltransferase
MKGEHISYIYTPTKKVDKSQLEDIKFPSSTISTLRKVKALPLDIILSYVYGKYLPERVAVH